MILIPSDQLTSFQIERLHELRQKTEQLINDCFVIEQAFSSIELPQLRAEFYKSRCAIADAQHQLLRQLGWRK